MRTLVDATVFVTSMIEEADDGPATRFFATDHEFCTAVTTLMEVRTVLSKKKRIEQEDVERTLDGIAARVDVYALERDDILTAYAMQSEMLLYPIDCLLFSLADDLDAELMTFDAELQDAGAKAPSDLS